VDVVTVICDELADADRCDRPISRIRLGADGMPGSPLTGPLILADGRVTDALEILVHVDEREELLAFARHVLIDDPLEWPMPPGIDDARTELLSFMGVPIVE
jgi:hypothetical protein